MTKAELKAIQAMWLLKLSYGIAIIVAGLDKMPFLHLVTQWEKYLNPAILQMIAIQPSFFMVIVGIAEIIVGTLILIKTRLGAWLAIIWLALVIINLFSMKTYFDIIVRDALLIVGLLALVWLNRAQADIAS
jgi:uncharacterized membrane protein YphA (DoxX/SURF4 family)